MTIPSMPARGEDWLPWGTAIDTTVEDLNLLSTESFNSFLDIAEPVSGSGNDASDVQSLGNSFAKLRFSTVIAGNAALFDNANDEYIVPSSGLYLVTARVRLIDTFPNGMGMGIGIHTSPIDGPWFAWCHLSTGSGVARQTVSYSRIMSCTAAQRLQVYTYLDTPSILTNRGATFTRIL